ncbi:MAG TPA: DUF4276 family protein, partial [Kofleriaceae bacterium]|nr:DUF4276 family protein [Kofleriaceae bacterium]
VHPHQGKGQLPKNLEAQPDPRHRGLLDMLPATLRAYSQAQPQADDGILVVVDLDDDEHEELETALKKLVESVPTLRARVSIAIEELEAFYLGDLKALKRTYPNADMERARAYEPDSVVGTAELFDQVISDGGLRKVEWAEKIGHAVTTISSRSRSPSFKRMCADIQELIDDATDGGQKDTKRKKHWKSVHSSIRKTKRKSKVRTGSAKGKKASRRVKKQSK